MTAPNDRAAAASSPTPSVPAVRIDPDLFDLSFQCRPDRCDARCCRTFHVEIDDNELGAILSLLDEAAVLAPGLREADGEYGDFYEEEQDDGVFSLVQDDDGCVFLYGADGGRRCAIHSVCLATGRPLERHKPLACLMWPLDLADDGSGGARLILSEGAMDFPCVERSKRAPLLEQYLPLFEALSGRWPFGELARTLAVRRADDR